jgi:hypothetical protein
MTTPSYLVAPTRDHGQQLQRPTAPASITAQPGAHAAAGCWGWGTCMGCMGCCAAWGGGRLGTPAALLGLLRWMRAALTAALNAALSALTVCLNPTSAHALPSERARTRASIRARTHTRFHQSTPGVHPGSCSCMLIGIPEEGLPDSSAFPCESRRGPPESVKIDDFHTFPKKKRSARRLSRSHPPQRVLGVRGLGV